MDKKYIVIVTNLFPNPVEPIRGIFIQQLVNALKQHFDIEVISPLPWFANIRCLSRFNKWYKFTQVPQEAKINGLMVSYPKYMVIPKILGFLHSVFLFFPLYRKISLKHKKRPIDLIIAYWLFPDAVSSLWVGKFLNIPVVVGARGCDINLYKSFKLRRPQIVSALRQAQMVTVVSREQKVTMESMGIPASKIRVIHNGIDLNKFIIQEKSVSRQQLKLSLDKKIILYIGRLSKEKGVSYLIDALKELKGKAADNLKVVIIGEGELKTNLETKVFNLDLEKKVAFAGERNYNEMMSWLNAADVLCLPSIREGCPNVMLEALACGVPVVAARVGAIPDFITENNGIMFESKNIFALRDALFTALNKTWDREKIRHSVSGRSWQEAADEYARVFNSILTKEK